MGIYDPSSVVVATNVNVNDMDNRKQYGSQVKACYALISNNTANAQGGIAFYDKFFQEIGFQADGIQASGNTSPHGGVTYYHGSSGFMLLGQKLAGVSPTQAYPSSALTTNFVNATNSAGELGSMVIDTFSNLTTTYMPNSAERGLINMCAINSDHPDKSIVYFLKGNMLFGVNRMQPSKLTSLAKMYGGSGGVTLPISSNTAGCGSYNYVRKQFVALSATANGGLFDLFVYNGIDLAANKNTDVAFKDKVPDKYSITLGTNWVTNDIESQNPRVVLCDNGDIYVVPLHTSSNVVLLYKITRLADGTYDSGSYVNKLATSAAYGRATNSLCGLRSLQSRDGSSVWVFCSYYYAGAGLVSIIIDKALSTYTLNFFQYADTTYGYQPVPYGDNGFACYYAGNFYTSNPGGGYISGVIERHPTTGGLMQTGGAVYLPYCPLPNTTNFPGLTQVNDYAMLEDQNTHTDKWAGRGV